jgi:ferredoxin-NADP reductase
MALAIRSVQGRIHFLAEETASAPQDGSDLHQGELIDRRWLSPKTFEIELSRPPAFLFTPGQTLCILRGPLERHYSMASSPQEPVIALCVRHLLGGALSPLIAGAPIGTRFTFRGPQGYFTFRPSAREAVFVATGCGVAPFASMVRSGVRPLWLLHGVRAAEDLYYRSLLSRAARTYVGCLSDGEAGAGFFGGRVTDFIKKHLPHGRYDFYLCGNQQMIRDVTLLADESFPGSFVFTEVFH